MFEFFNENQGDRIMRSALKAAAGSLTLFVVMQLGACSKEAPEPATGIQMRTAVGTTSEFVWLSQGTPAGESTVVRTGDGKETVESFMHWNNREYRVNSELQLNANGIPIAQRITGISPFGATIDESFAYEDGVASWSTAGESGSVTTDDPGFYLPTEYGSLGMTTLVQAALKNMDGELAILPSGTARVEKLTSADVDTPDGTQVLSLYSIAGLGFTPVYAWFDENMEVAVLDFGGYMGMYPKGWSSEVLDQLWHHPDRGGCEDDRAYLWRSCPCS